MTAIRHAKTAARASISARAIRSLRRSVLQWFEKNGRDFPWRQSREPYHLLIAEALLRQTQAPRVVEAYCELVEAYPNVQALSQADPQELRTLFKNLGLIQRADRLVQAAKIIVAKHHGRVPDDLESLLALPGVGIYSARAIQCVAFNKRVAMVDEGTGRVLRRLFGISSERPAFSDASLRRKADGLIPHGNARDFNHALLDIAATICRPSRPNCARCPLYQFCGTSHEFRLQLD